MAMMVTITMLTKMTAMGLVLVISMSLKLV